jgi:hypothetical protein
MAFNQVEQKITAAGDLFGKQQMQFSFANPPYDNPREFASIAAMKESPVV